MGKTFGTSLFLYLAMLVLPVYASPGDLNSGFDPGSGADSVVSSVALQPDGKVLIGGLFFTVNRRVSKVRTAPYA